MTVLNDLDRSHLAGDVIDRVKQMMQLAEQKPYDAQHGQDMLEIRNWEWPSQAGRGGREESR